MDYDLKRPIRINLQPAFTEDGSWIGMSYQTTDNPAKICIDSPLSQYAGNFTKPEMIARGIKIPNGK